MEGAHWETLVPDLWWGMCCPALSALHLAAVRLDPSGRYSAVSFYPFSSELGTHETPEAARLACEHCVAACVVMDATGRLA